MKRSSFLVLILACVFQLCGCAQQPAENDPVVDRPPRKVAGIDPATLTDMLAYQDDDRDVQKRYAATMIGITRELSAVEVLNEKVVGDRDPKVRAACAWAIGEIREDGQLNFLEKALNDRDAAVRSAAIYALGRFDSPRALTLLQKIAGEGKGPEALTAFRSISSKDNQERHDLLAKLNPGNAERFVASGQGLETLTGKTWYVESSAGDDNNEGSAKLPFRTLGRAVKELRAGAGDRIFAASSDTRSPFRESVDIPNQFSGLPNSPTVIAAWPGKNPPILDGAKEEAPEVPALEDGIHVGASFVHIKGVVVRHYKDSGIDIDGGTGCVVADCTVERCDRHGIFFYYAPRCSVINAKVSGCNFQGISIRTSPYAVVLGGSSNDNGIDGLLFLWDTDDVVVDGFRAGGNQRGVGFIRGSQRGRIYRSDITGNKTDVGVDSDCSVELIDMKAETRS